MTALKVTYTTHRTNRKEFEKTQLFENDEKACDTCVAQIIRTPSRIDATAKRVDGAISFSSLLMLLSRLSAVSFTPSIISLYRSVLAVHNTMTWKKENALNEDEINVLL